MHNYNIPFPSVMTTEGRPFYNVKGSHIGNRDLNLWIDPSMIEYPLFLREQGMHAAPPNWAVRGC